ncbi:hypothetical protein [Ralstonia pseudosolanacearum]|uniref:hypothetical protein n=1 Tax=Ralstonia pseudosolanacearum TaxID=1310165 RepID=UPI00126946D7|nr:hypothetical protein [Ralstonia pseudosolanacearum]MDO3558277.1 hypothetical protein [Ralstonia pseudosolanacearum]MDO3575530.1 hypothetical protein [Ralstonia pseudosolanacearum]MDO3586902.1 hypothetical protein [Ralstonia pseudosolanacearum]
MNHTVTTPGRAPGRAAKAGAQPDLVYFRDGAVAPRFRRVLRESFSMDWVDFISGVLVLLRCGKPLNNGMWTLPNGLCVCADANSDFAMCVHETGWSRWRLPSRDGVVRSVDWSAPWLTRSPSGALFWVFGSEMRRICGVSDLVRQISYYLPVRGGAK